MPLLQNWEVFSIIFCYVPIKHFLIAYLHSTHLNTNEPQLTVMYSRSKLQVLHLSLKNPLVILSIRIENEHNINLTLSMTIILHVIILPLLIGTAILIYFSLFSLKLSNCPSNSFTDSDYEVVVIIRTTIEHHWNLFWCDPV